MEGSLCIWRQTFQPLASIVLPDGREARGSAGATVQPIEFVQFQTCQSNFRIFLCGLLSGMCALPWKVDLEVNVEAFGL